MDRDAARARLRSLAEQGLIDPANLDAQLAALDAGDTSALVMAQQGYALAGYREDDPLVISAGWSNQSRDGNWVVPPYLDVQAKAANVRLNFLQAQASAPLIQVEISGAMGNVKLIVPDGWAVNADRLRGGMGSAKIRVPNQPAPGCPVLLLRGSLAMGNLKVRYGTRGELRRSQRALRGSAALSERALARQQRRLDRRG
ncbi:hypothetical protein ATK74_1087 [Propionicimonas paludicola]|uniref:Cell wall-active antibiotic response 4TMS protein YvqF n=2 Tax=Propionicimonas paludicola TaxID=185243 RepID=A0A2A9CSG0_9ACTN|nr:hypothetical protein ATK74_1087 [Propionicimonas paludicola]